MEPKTITAATLDDLGPVPVVVTLARPDGVRVDVTLRALTADEVARERRAVKWPAAPITDYKKIGGEVLPVYNREDPGFLAAVAEANNEYARRIFLACLQLQIPGDTDAEKLDALKTKLGHYAAQQLVEATQRLNFVDAEEIAAVGRSFRAG